MMNILHKIDGQPSHGLLLEFIHVRFCAAAIFYCPLKISVICMRLSIRIQKAEMHKHKPVVTKQLF
jgi:hypothetical protein